MIDPSIEENITPDVKRRGVPRPDPVNSGFPPVETGGGGTHTHTHTHTHTTVVKLFAKRRPGKLN